MPLVIPLAYPCGSRHGTCLVSLVAASSATSDPPAVNCPPRLPLFSQLCAITSSPWPWPGTMASSRRNTISEAILCSLVAADIRANGRLAGPPDQCAFRFACADLLVKSFGSTPAPGRDPCALPLRVAGAKAAKPAKNRAYS